MPNQTKTLVIVIHPNMKESRINKRLAEQLKSKENITVHPLHQAYPDENINVAEEQRLLTAHDRIVLQFPLYWYSSPYFLKKWIDQVLLSGWAYSGGKALAGKELCIATSTGAVEAAYQAGGRNNYSLSELLRPFQAMANITGMTYKPAFVITGVPDLKDEQLEKYARDYEEYVTQ